VLAALQQHDLAFYSTAAQVLPVLVIVAIVELRYLPARTENLPELWRQRITMGYCGIATIAEFQLLLDLATNEKGRVTSIVAMIALTFGILMVFSAPVIALDRARSKGEAEAKQDQRNQI
jgi:hypothetical protein